MNLFFLQGKKVYHCDDCVMITKRMLMIDSWNDRWWESREREICVAISVSMGLSVVFPRNLSQSSAVIIIRI